MCLKKGISGRSILYNSCVTKFFLILFGFFLPKKIKNTLIKTCSLNLNPAINCHSYVNYIDVNICFSTVLAISSICMK